MQPSLLLLSQKILKIKYENFQMLWNFEFFKKLKIQGSQDILLKKIRGNFAPIPARLDIYLWHSMIFPETWDTHLTPFEYPGFNYNFLTLTLV